MSLWLHIGEKLKANAERFPDKLAVKDDFRSLTFKQFNERACRLANGLRVLGLKKGDRLAIVSQNRVEWMEIYAACAKSGIVAVPINWRLVGNDIVYIVDHADARALIVHDSFVPEVEKVKKELRDVRNFIHIGPMDRLPAGWISYEDVVENGGPEEPDIKIVPEDIWIQIYTSGTTEKPKGVLRSHRSYVAHFLITGIEFQFHRDDYGMIVMPLHHVNSTFYSFVFTYIGASVFIFPDFNYKADKLLDTVDREKVTFISLVPTHYALILSVPQEIKDHFDGKSIKQLLTSSMPLMKEIKKDIVKFFTKAKLFEAYGSTEAGLVTILRPEEQLSHLGSVGKECIGSDTIKILDENRRPVPVGEVGELYSRSPMLFTGYHKQPARTREAFTEDGYFSAGDLARRDKDGYYHIVDRKANMIITGGEHVYPREVEETIEEHPAVASVAVIGTPDEKWGEQVTAVVVLKEGKTATDEEILLFCKGSLPGFKCPRRVLFIKEEEMPRTSTGKLIHRELKERYKK
jgi:acyl-CoA synthetase (AMP-forming)/AMP-acid ligase II